MEAPMPSFLKTATSNIPKSKVILWPLPSDDPERKVRIKILGCRLLEKAHVLAEDYFKEQVKKGNMAEPPDEDSDVFRQKERCAQVYLAYETLGDDPQPIADDAGEVFDFPPEIVGPLVREWNAFQSSITARPMSKEDKEAYIEELKKNYRSEILAVLPLTWLIELSSSLASRLASLTPPSGGS
jgi:hypothetical protein